MFKVNRKYIIIVVLLITIGLGAFYVWSLVSESTLYDGEQKDIIRTTISLDPETVNIGFECRNVISVTNSGDWTLAEVELVDSTGTSTINSMYILKKSSSRSYEITYGVGDEFNESRLKDANIPINIVNELKSNIKETGAVSEND